MDEGFVAFLLIVGLAIYFIPTVIAAVRAIDHGAGVFLLNLVLGWTLIGWVGALIWALCATGYEDKLRQAAKAVAERTTKRAIAKAVAA
jgi:hypothetical protein